jgi:hypothetical protein
MTSLRDVANITFYDRKTGKKIIETPINNFTNTKEVVSNIPYNNLIPFRIQFDDCMEIQVFVTKETYQAMMDYKNKTK